MLYNRIIKVIKMLKATLVHYWASQIPLSWPRDSVSPLHI